MNNSLLLSIIKNSREYKQLISSINKKTSTKNKPNLATGLSEGATRYFRAALTEDISKISNVLILFQDDREAKEEAAFLESLGINSKYFPSRDFNFNNITASHEFENERLDVLKNVIETQSGTVVCAGISASLQVTISPENYKNKTITISEKDSVDTGMIIEKLYNAGYKRVDLVEGPGQYALRGGIIDIYSSDGKAYRIELFGDEIDRMGYFNPESQRFTDFCDNDIVIPPAREMSLSDDDRDLITETVNKQLKRIEKVKDVEVKSRAKKLLENEINGIDNSFEVDFADKYIPVIHKDGKSLCEIFKGLIIFGDPGNLSNKINASRTLLEQTLLGLCESFELPTEIADTTGYIRSFDYLTDKFSDNNTVIIDSISRNYKSFTVGAEYDFNTRHISSYADKRELLYEDISGYRLRGWTVFVVCQSESERSGVTNRLISEGVTAASAENYNNSFDKIEKGVVYTLTGNIFGGFELQTERIAVMDNSSNNVHLKTPRQIKKKKKNTESIMSYADLEVGDIVVHAAYGIGLYMGIENLVVAGVSRDYVSLKYSGDDMLYLPVDQLDMVSKYIGAGSDTGAVKLSRMGGADWKKAKNKARAATKEMAKELIELYASRKRAKGFAFDADDDMCREFADSFEYEETDGQLQAIEDVRRDMEAECPMDRLICGDVGYGKTEVALRAAFKAVMSGKQVAVLVPTTILAYQHYKTFKSRMRQFPANIDMVSRFRSQAEQKAALRRLKRGETDVIIGTHRLFSGDVEFNDLGLVIIDEEQRFGVAQKEKLKKMAIGSDVLTLTATPIPRTLNMAMGGIVDMSLLEEAPGERAPVQTYVLEYDDNIIYEAIRRELRRDGQVFYMYNRVEGIYNVAGRIQKAIPEARIAVAHGKMEREELEEIWESLIKGEIDILVCTTIIETGVDIPNANTLIIENADTYGLSQLHQIRGRVGRSGRRAYAYFTYKMNKQISEVAERRLSAIKEYAQFGAGFRIALRDLEIRGAGNLLGAEQHGHIETVGYDLYMKLLEEAVIEEKGEKKPEKVECSIDIEADAYLSKNYIPFQPQRMELYKKIAKIETEEDYEDILDELCDRFGEPSTPAVNLCRIALIKATASSAGVTKISQKNFTVTFTPKVLNPTIINKLAEKYNKSKIHVQLGRESQIEAIMPKGERNTEFLMEFFEYYKSIINEYGEGTNEE